MIAVRPGGRQHIYLLYLNPSQNATDKSPRILTKSGEIIGIIPVLPGNPRGGAAPPQRRPARHFA